jgi:hypothetical protein
MGRGGYLKSLRDRGPDRRAARHKKPLTWREDAGMGCFAEWLKPPVPEVPVTLVPTIDEFWAV